MPILRRLLRAIRTNWPRTKIMLRADSHYCCPEVLDFCRVNGLDYILGVAPTTTLRRHIGDLEASVKARYEAAPKDGKARRYKEFYDGAASWSRVEAGAEGPDTRFVVTNLKKRNARKQLKGHLLAAEPDELDRPTAFGCPHGHEAMHGAEIPIDLVSVSFGLAVDPGVADPFQVATAALFIRSAMTSSPTEQPDQILIALAKRESPHSYRGRMKSDWVWIARPLRSSHFRP
jgi:Transposase DDE domain group 1